MGRNFKIILLTVLTLSIFTLVIIELTGVSRNTFFRAAHRGGEGNFYSRDGVKYSGEIFPEDIRHRDEIASKMPKTSMQFYETKHNFGSVPSGKVVSHAFRFKNTGDHPLYISKTDVSCGCTVPSFPLETVPPGQDGDIVVNFDTEGKSGIVQKNIIVHSNAVPEAVSIGIEADVK